MRELKMVAFKSLEGVKNWVAKLKMTVNEQFTAHFNTFAYMASGKMMGTIHHEINRVNIRTGKAESFDFGAGEYCCGEPIFIPKPQHVYNLQNEPGWLMTLVFNEKRDKSYLAILNAEAVGDGPIAKVHLKHHSPMSFHGIWHEG